jgi:hypothetical protein
MVEPDTELAGQDPSGRSGELELGLREPVILLAMSGVRESGRDSGHRKTAAFDPGCVKTLCCYYDSPAILGGIDEALR